MRRIDILMDGYDLLHNIEDGGSIPGDIEDDELDLQLTDLAVAGYKAGLPYNLKTIKVGEVR